MEPVGLSAYALAKALDVPLKDRKGPEGAMAMADGFSMRIPEPPEFAPL
jgi:hypothetical protein